MGLFSIKKKAPFEPAVEDLSAVYGADSHIDASEFETIGKDAENMESIVRPSSASEGRHEPCRSQ